MTIISLLGTIVLLAPLFLLAVLGIASLVGSKPGEKGTTTLVAIVTFTGLICSIAIFIGMIASGQEHIVLSVGDWVRVHDPEHPKPYHFTLKFVFDRLSVPFLMVTYLLIGVIGAFSTRYMHREPGFNRFFTLFALFLVGMVVTTLADTIETLFLGWEMVGLSSVLLVGFFQERPSPVRNGLRVWVVYRVSDAALLLAAVLLHHTACGGDLDKMDGYTGTGGTGTVSWPHGVSILNSSETLMIGGLLLIAAAGKSALIPFSGWLPRAMEGPTPSSAVFYGALSVHLGAYLLLQVSPLLDASPALSTAVCLLGLATAAYAAITARAQTDIKSALSFASLTQVGFIVAEIGIGWRYIPLFHIIGHACLRTLQFIRAPTLLQDMRHLENALGERLPRKAGGTDAWLYRFALERGYLDALLNRFVVDPFLYLFRRIDAFERACAARINGRRT